MKEPTARLTYVFVFVCKKCRHDICMPFHSAGPEAEVRTVVFTKECRSLVTELWRGKLPEDYLFTRENGVPVRDFRGAWEVLVTAAKLPALLFHDLRRSAVRNMIRRGVPQKTAREISGHKTDSLFSRYNIVSEDDIRDAARKIEEGAKAALKGEIHSSHP
jgi:integrase